MMSVTASDGIAKVYGFRTLANSKGLEVPKGLEHNENGTSLERGPSRKGQLKLAH